MTTTWEIFHTMIAGEYVRLDIADLDGLTAGWVVRRACNVYQAFKPSSRRPESGVVDLLSDGVMIGQAGNADDARAILVDELGIPPAAPVSTKVATIHQFERPQP